jgi:tetratricopeptide (TPR) repeat protein
MFKHQVILLLIALSWTWQNPVQAQEFAGSEACRGCHERPYEAWTGSHHQMAMQVADETTVLGDFNDAEFEYGAVTSRFFRRDGAFFVRTDGADGALDDFEITHTFGVYPLQQFLVTFSDGRLQTLGIAWDSRPAEAGGQRWFHVYPEAGVDHEDELHWTGALQNWNFMCADCHSTNLRKNYQPKSDRFETTWSEISVGCEACHGPGSGHIAWAGTPEAERAESPTMGLTHRLDERAAVQWVIPAGGATAQRSEQNEKRKEIEVCASCHSRRGILSEGAALDASFLDHYMPALLTDGLYYADGQIRDEVYVWGSFLQSKMHGAGVTCSDCHDPHSQQLKLPGDAVCTQCHQASMFAAESHHRHPVESAGARCANCHMPETTYMVVDPRRDHSIRIPRPDLARETGAPDACSGCHRDRPAGWAAERFREGYPERSATQPAWPEALQAARNGHPLAGNLLAQIVTDTDLPVIVRATAALELGAYLSAATAPAIQAALRDDHPLLRLAAARALEPLPPERALPVAAHLLQDDYLTVRTEAARLMAGAPAGQMNPAGKSLLDGAIREYIATQELNADRSENQLNLGNLYAGLGDAARAEHHYREALEREPGFAPAWTNLAELYRTQNMNPAAEQTLRQGLEQTPDSAVLHHALGLALIRSGRQAEALQQLEEAENLEPGNARYAYVHGIALNSSGRSGEALETLRAANGRHPDHADILFALATISRDRGQVEQARKWAGKLLGIDPGNQQAQALLDSLEGE